MCGLSLETCTADLKSVVLTILNWSDWLVHCAHTNTDTQTHIERTHYLRHSLRSLGGDNKHTSAACISKNTPYITIHNLGIYRWLDVFCSHNCCSSKRLCERKNSQSSRSIFWRKFSAACSHSVLRDILSHLLTKWKTNASVTASDDAWSHDTGSYRVTTK